MTNKQLARQIKYHADRIGKERDALRQLTCEIADIEDASDRATDALQEAIDVLSEHL